MNDLLVEERSRLEEKLSQHLFKNPNRCRAPRPKNIARKKKKDKEDRMLRFSKKQELLDFLSGRIFSLSREGNQQIYRS